MKFTKTDRCLQRYICEYFGDETDDECDNCKDKQPIDVKIAIRNRITLDLVQENLDKIKELEKRKDVWRAESCCDCGKIFPIFKSTWSHCRETGEGLPKRCEECGIR